MGQGIDFIPAGTPVFGCGIRIRPGGNPPPEWETDRYHYPAERDGATVCKRCGCELAAGYQTPAWGRDDGQD